MAAVLLGFAVVVLLAMIAAGAPGLTAATFPAVLSVAVAAAWLVPRFVDKPRRSRVGTAAIVVFGALEIIGVVGALSSERVGPPGPQGLAFAIPRTMFDVDHKFLDLPSGARVHYVDEGEGETLLFLHGNPSWSFQWRDLIRGLRGSYRCVALDYPGFGLSEAPAGFGFTPREESLVVERRHSSSGRFRTWGFHAAILRGSNTSSRTTRRSSSPTQTTSSSKMKQMP